MKTIHQLHLCILVTGFLVHHAAGKPVERFTLDRDTPLVIPVGVKTATTVQFPRSIQGLFGYGLTKGDVPGTYHYAHPEGSRVLTLRNLVPDKEAFVSVLLGKDDLFVLHLKPSADPPVTVHLFDPSAIEAARLARAVDSDVIAERKLDPGTARLFNLLKLGKNERTFRNAVPHLYQNVESLKVEFRHDDGQVATVVTHLHRFPDEDANFLNAYIANSTDKALQFDPGSLQVKVGSRTYPAALVDSAAEIPPNGKIPLHVIIRGGIEGERAHLSIKNEHRLIMPAYAPCIDDPALADALGLVIAPPDNIYMAGDDGPDGGLFPEQETNEGGSK
ncbi:MAG: hypothetical protein KDN22_10365 [Verrucomicrobiae bacterium]|nr:hypothetical protein [Verrucomicrobiae bacterium]